MVWNLAIGWEIICSLTQLTGAKARKKILRIWGKFLLWTYSIGLWHSCCTSIKSSKVYWLDSCASVISLQLSTSWSCKSSSKAQFQKPLLVTRAPSDGSFIQHPVYACLLNALFRVAIDCWHSYKIHNDSLDLQMLGKNECWSYALSTT